MDFPDELRYAEESLSQAEKEFLAGTDGVAKALLVRYSTGTFASDAAMAQERMAKLDESRYIKWSRWVKKHEFSASFWKDEGYPSIDTTTLQASNPDWYSKRTGTTQFVKDLMIHREILPPTVEKGQDEVSTPQGDPSNRWLLDFVVLSSLRLSLKKRWEQLVNDIVKKRPQTDLTLVAERLGLEIAEVVAITQKIRDLDDRVIEYDVSDSRKNLTYQCRRPNPNLTPAVDIIIDD
ncbi:MAG: hypothetical protein ACFFED_08350 [Candidatus Thorarchaeota archaeon]